MKIILVIAAFFSSSQFAFARTEGGISGGGGGIGRSAPAGPTRIMDALQESRLTLQLYFNARQQAEEANPSPLGNLLFAGERTIFDLIRTSPIEAAKHSACRDPHSRRRDGAAPGYTPNSICISVKNLGRALTLSDYSSQTTALVAHEFAHLLGADERAARALQGEVLRALRNTAPSLPSAIRLGANQRLANLLQNLSYAQNAEHIPGIGRNLRDLAHEIVKSGESLVTEGYLHGRPLLPFGTSEQQTWISLFQKIRSLYQIENSEAFALVAKDALEDALQLRAALDQLMPVWSPLNPLQSAPAQPSANPCSWQTVRATLNASDFKIVAGGVNFYGGSSGLELHSDYGNSQYWTLEAKWVENGREMRINFYFRADLENWWVSEIRTYDGSAQDDWIYYRGEFFKAPIGAAFHGSVKLNGLSERGTAGSLEFRDLVLSPSFL